jgi:hypothetical protein
MTRLRSILALMQLVALMQIGWAVIAPGVSSGNKSDLEASIHRGGDVAVEQWRRSEENDERSNRRLGIGLGGAVFVLATTATILNGRKGPQRESN